MGAALPQTTLTSSVVTFNGLLSALCITLAGDGLNIIYVDDFSGMSLSSVPGQYFTDNLHPNNYGQFSIARQWVSALYSALIFPKGSGINGDAFAQICVANGVTPEVLVSLVTAVIWGMFNTSLQQGVYLQAGLTGGTAATATGGSATLPTNPVDFLYVQLADSLVKVPYYS
jgi:hypothetical protein